jgi:hypothetical protein
MPFYAQISSENKVKQLFYQQDATYLSEIIAQYPDDTFIETEYFGDADCFAYEDGKLIPVEPPVSNDYLIAQNRIKRNEYLSTSDWTQLPDVPLDQAVKDKWAVYRQALRDMTQQNLLDGTFPLRPTPAIVNSGVQGTTNP